MYLNVIECIFRILAYMLFSISGTVFFQNQKIKKLKKQVIAHDALPARVGRFLTPTV